MKILINYLQHLKLNNQEQYAQLMRGYDSEHHLIQSVTPWVENPEKYYKDVYSNGKTKQAN